MSIKPDIRLIPPGTEPSVIVPNPNALPGARITACNSQGKVQDGFACFQVEKSGRKYNYYSRRVSPGDTVTVVSNDGYNCVVRFSDGQEFATQACQARFVLA